MTIERRHYHRVNFDTVAQLTLGSETIRCELLDLCLQGALLKCSSEQDIQLNDHGQLCFTLSDEEPIITMDVTVVHRTNDCIGVYCDTIDIDSMSHLRRLIELNVGDAEVLKRDFKSLLAN
ncbi:MAG: PilZ domain-containing protein [Gammaproteobacteria bacterium]|nr:PilZ domain-containing protein [Gammaproteobacteria bacterium]